MLTKDDVETLRKVMRAEIRTVVRSEIDTALVVFEKRFEKKMDTKFEAIDVRFEKIDKKLKQIDRKFILMENRFIDKLNLVIRTFENDQERQDRSIAALEARRVN
jgi:histidinol dehydrogenase